MGIVNVTPDSFSDGGEWFEREDGVLVDLEERGGLGRREHVGQVGRAERVVADDELRIVGLDHDPARQRAGRLGAEAAQGVQAVVRVGVDVARDEAGDEVLLRGADGVGGAVELARLRRREADEQRGGVGGGGGAAWGHISQDIMISLRGSAESPGVSAGLG